MAAVAQIMTRAVCDRARGGCGRTFTSNGTTACCQECIRTAATDFWITMGLPGIPPPGRTAPARRKHHHGRAHR